MNTLPATVAAKPAPQFTPIRFDNKELDAALNLTSVTKELGAAIADYDKHVGNAVLAAIRIGHAAMTAKDMLPEGQFTKWLESSFPGFSVQWARRCMQAAESYLQLQQDCASDADRETIMARMTSVERMAALGGVLKGKDVGESPLSALERATPPAKKTGRPPKVAKAAGAPASTRGAPVLEGSQGKRSAAELLEWEEALQEREDKVAAEEERLAAWAAELAELQQKLTLAAQPAADTPAAVIEQAGGDVAHAERPKWPFTPAQLAAGKAEVTDVQAKTPPAASGKARTSRAKPKSTVAKSAPENGSGNDVM